MTDAAVERCSDVQLLHSIFLKHIKSTDPYNYTTDLKGPQDDKAIVARKTLLIEIREKAHQAGVLVQKPTAAAIGLTVEYNSLEVEDVEKFSDTEAKK